MHIKEALDLLEEKAKNTLNSDVKSTLWDIHGVLLRAGTRDCKRWSAKIEDVIAYVEAGNFAYCYPDAKKLLNKNIYAIPEKSKPLRGGTLL